MLKPARGEAISIGDAVAVTGTLESGFVRKSAKTRSWEKAEELKRQWEEAETPRKAEPVTIEKAVESHLADAKARELREATIWKLETIFRKQFLGGQRRTASGSSRRSIFRAFANSGRRGRTVLSPRRRNRSG